MTIYIEPKPGMVINYSYLWARQANQGMVYGEKYRPSLILAVKQEEEKKMVYVSPITHTPPFYPEESLLMPQADNDRLGLDNREQWLMLSEVNKFEWPGTEIRRVPRRAERSQFYGFISGQFLSAAQNKLRDLVNLKMFKTVAREMTERPETFQPQPYKAPAPVPQPMKALG